MKRTLYQAACVAIPKGLGGLLTIVLNSLLMTRMSPVEFGTYAVCLTLVSLADGVVGAAIDMSTVKLASAHRLHDMRRAAIVQRWGLTVKLGLGLVLTAVALPLASELSQALLRRADGQLLLLVLAVTGGVLMMRSIGVSLQLAQRFEAYALLELIAQAMRVLGIAAVVLWSVPTALHLNVAALVGTGVSLAAGMFVARLPWAPRHWPPLTRHDGAELLRTLRWMMATFALSSLIARVDVLLMARWSAMEQVALYAAAQVYATIPEMLGMWLAVVFSPRVAPAQAQGQAGALLRRALVALTLLAVLVGLLAALVLALAGHLIPAHYADLPRVLLPLLVGSLAGMTAMPVAVPCVMFNRPGLIVMLDLISLPFLLLAYHVAITDSGALGAAWVSGAARIIKAGLIHAFALRWTHTAGMSADSRSP